MKYVAFIVVGLVLLIGMVQCTAIPDRISCHSRWSASGYETKFGVMSGCIVQVKGRWIPENAVRDISP
jgi:hypothetical protein